jgi:hypothetical protein
MPVINPAFHAFFPYTGHTQKNGAVSKVNTIDTAPFFCVYSVYWPTAGTGTMKQDSFGTLK